MRDMYCSKVDEGKYKYFFGNRVAVSLCGVKKESIIKVRLHEAGEEEPHTHFGYLDVENGEYHFIFDNYVSVKICSPNGFQSEIASGKGRIVKLIVEEVSEVEETTKLRKTK